MCGSPSNHTTATYSIICCRISFDYPGRDMVVQTSWMIDRRFHSPLPWDDDFAKSEEIERLDSVAVLLGPLPLHGKPHVWCLLQPKGLPTNVNDSSGKLKLGIWSAIIVISAVGISSNQQEQPLTVTWEVDAPFCGSFHGPLTVIRLQPRAGQSYSTISHQLLSYVRARILNTIITRSSRNTSGQSPKLHHHHQETASTLSQPLAFGPLETLWRGWFISLFPTSLELLSLAFLCDVFRRVIGWAHNWNLRTFELEPGSFKPVSLLSATSQFSTATPILYRFPKQNPSRAMFPQNYPSQARSRKIRQTFHWT